jgi:hypothetical protein
VVVVVGAAVVVVVVVGNVVEVSTVRPFATQYTPLPLSYGSPL